MHWDDIIAEVEDRIGSTAGETGRYTKHNLRRIGAQVQQEIARVTGCYEIDDTSITTVASQKAYTLPDNFYEMQRITVDNVDLYQTDRLPLPMDYPTGQPTSYILRGEKKVWLYPAPSASGDTVATYYRALSPLYGMYFVHVANASNTAATLTITGSTMVIVVVGGTDAQTKSYNLTTSTTDTISELVTVINNDFTTITVYKDAFCNDNRACTDLEVVSSRSIFNKKYYAMLAPEIPADAHQIIIEGILERLKYKDREIDFEQLSKSVYYQMMEAKKRQHQGRNIITNNNRIKNTRRRSSDHAGIQVFIP